MKPSSSERPSWDRERGTVWRDQDGPRPATIVGVTVLLAFGSVAGLSWWAAASGSGAAATHTGPAYLNLTIALNPHTGMPQYSPANFSVPTGKVIVTIVDDDMAMNWSGCQCHVSGTAGGIEYVNGTPLSVVSSSNVAHTFSIPSLGLNILSPGQSVVSFTLDLTETGTFSWFCFAPCGANGYSGAPMGAPGYMTGTMSVL